MKGLLLTGQYQRVMDDKQRLAIPKRIRDALGEAANDGLYVTPGTDGSLAIHTANSLSLLAARLAAASPTQQDVRAFGRLFYSNTDRVELDSQGRIPIAPNLVTLARIDKEVVLLGVGDHLEVWCKALWDEYSKQRQSQYDQIAEAAFAPRDLSAGQSS